VPVAHDALARGAVSGVGAGNLRFQISNSKSEIALPRHPAPGTRHPTHDIRHLPPQQSYWKSQAIQV